MRITDRKSYKDGRRDRECGFEADPMRRGWYTPVARRAYYEGYGSIQLVQGWLFNVH